MAERREGQRRRGSRKRAQPPDACGSRHRRDRGEPRNRACPARPAAWSTAMNLAHFRFALILVATATFTGCVIAPPGPSPEVVRLQGELDRLHANPDIVAYGGQELVDADAAVEALARADSPRHVDEAFFHHRVYIADRLVQTAE